LDFPNLHIIIANNSFIIRNIISLKTVFVNHMVEIRSDPSWTSTSN